MAPPSGHESAPVSERLFREPFRFDFFQAVRLLEQIERARGAGGARRSPVGQDRAPGQEVVRFRALPALSFPAGAIGQLRPATEGDGPAEMVVTFLGLTGPSGVLPAHYTTLLLQRLRLRDHSLRDFLDLFNHRTISLFYRAWEKYRFPLGFERARLDGPPGEPDLFAQCLYGLVGLGTGGLRDRLQAPPEAFLYYSGLFAHFPRSAIGLQQLLADHFEFPVRVEQFEGQWLYLEEDDRTRLGPDGLGQNNQLGLDVVVGQRTWDVQSKVRLRLGPLTYEQFRRLLPGGVDRPALVEMARSYVGPELDFDAQLVLLPLEVPWCQLGPDEDGFRLGQSAWVRAHDFDEAVEDATFAVEDG